MTAKSTYAFDPETVRALEKLATRWQVSKSEALRRMIRAALEGGDDAPGRPIQVLDRLQESIRLTPAAAKRWTAEVRAERRASGGDRGRRGR